MAAGERRPMGSAYANPGGRLGAAACRPGARPPMRPKRPNCPWQSARTTRGAGVDGVRRVRHGGAHAAPAAVPHHAREAQLRAAERRRQPGCVVAVVGVGSEAVEVVRREAGVRRGGEDRLAGELELAAVRDPTPRPVLRLADADDGDAVAHGRGASPPSRTGVNPRPRRGTATASGGAHRGRPAVLCETPRYVRGESAVARQLIAGRGCGRTKGW